MKLVLAEKPSVAQSIAKVLGAAKREDGYLEGNGYVVSWCVGHLVELAQPEVYDANVYPYTPIRSSFENAGSIEEMMLYTELQSAVHAMIQRLEYSFTFNPSLLTSPKRKQQVTEILEEAEKYIWRIKEEMRCA